MKLLTLVLVLATLLFGKVDINSADSKALQGIKGIGPKTAAAILEYRGQKCFDSTEEITKVRGIGQKTLEKIKDSIEALPCKETTAAK